MGHLDTGEEQLGIRAANAVRVSVYVAKPLHGFAGYDIDLAARRATAELFRLLK
jgi:hypothetical protein